MTAPVVDRETAETEVNEWLDAKKIFPSTREENKDAVELLIESVMLGVLTLEKKDGQVQEYTFIHKLLFPLGDNGESVQSLSYRYRVNDKILQRYLKGVSAKDGDGRLNATIAGLTGTSRGIIEGLDTQDKKVSNAIAIFFF